MLAKKKTHHAGGFVLVNESLLLAASGEGDRGEGGYNEGERRWFRHRALTWRECREVYGRADLIEIQQVKKRSSFVAKGVGTKKEEIR